jgi:dTDP-4-dehydrorhamnose 3,5-epimerase-like enzyme
MTASDYDPALYQNQELWLDRTAIPGLLIVHQVVKPDGRGWTKDSFPRRALLRLGFPADFTVAGDKLSSVRERGFTRGIHADTVNKYVTLNSGRAFAAFVDLRAGETFGAVETVTLTPGTAAFVPRGCGNSYQALTPGVQYAYLEDERTSTEPSTRVSLGAPELGIDWPIPLDQAILLPDDRADIPLAAVTPVNW